MQLQVIENIPLNCVAACWDETYRFLGFVVCLVFFTLSATLSGLHLASVWVFLDTIGSDVVDGGSGSVIICQQPVDQHTGMHQLTQRLCVASFQGLVCSLLAVRNWQNFVGFRATSDERTRPRNVAIF